MHAASSTTAPTSADGSTVKSSGTVGVGVALAIEVAGIKTKAWIGGANELHASGGITVEAPMFHNPAEVADSYSAIAKPGSGNATKVSVAGALAVLVVTIERSALVNGGTVDVNGGDLTLTSVSNSSSIAKAAASEDVFDPNAAGLIDGSTWEFTLPYTLKHGTVGTPHVVTGDTVEYSSGGGTSIGGLVDGATYYAIVADNAHPEKIKLAKNAADATAGTAIHVDKTKATGKEHSLTLTDVSQSRTIDPATAVDTSTNQITLSSALTHNGGGALADGDKLSYDAGETAGAVNTAIGGLQSGQSYYAIVVDSTHIKLSDTAEHAKAGTNVVSLSSGATGTNHKLTLTEEDSPSSGVGIGASVAINVLTDTTSAGVSDGATLAGAHNLTISATTTESMTTDAANGASGGIAVTPIAAIAISTVETYALIGTGGTSCGSNGGFLCLTGNLVATAAQTASSDAKAKGATTGSNVAVGASLALNVATHTVQATTKRNLDAGGSVSFSAIGASATSSDATASASGASEDDGGSGDTVNSKADDHLTSTNQQSQKNGGKQTSESSTPDAKDSDGNTVTVAAAVAFNLVHSTSDASLAQGLHIHAGGALTLQSKANTDAHATADGEASSDGGTATIGAAVAINLATVVNHADLGPGATTDSTDLTLSALMNAVGAGSSDRKHEFEATATSGAGGGGTVAVAGSFALNIVDVSSTALMRADGIRGPPTVNSSNNVLLESESSVSSTTKALSVKQVFDPQTAVADNAIQLPSVLKHADGSPLKTGDAVIYSDGGGAPIGGLEDGHTYFVRVTGAGKSELYDTKAHADNTASTDGRKALDKAKARGSEHAFTVGGSSEGAKVGVGASISLNLVTDVTQAGVQDDTTSLAHNIVGAHNITVHANGENALETEAQSGSAGGVAVTAAIAVAIDNVTTSASFGTGARDRRDRRDRRARHSGRRDEDDCQGRSQRLERRRRHLARARRRHRQGRLQQQARPARDRRDLLRRRPVLGERELCRRRREGRTEGRRRGRQERQRQGRQGAQQRQPGADGQHRQELRQDRDAEGIDRREGRGRRLERRRQGLGQRRRCRDDRDHRDERDRGVLERPHDPLRHRRDHDQVVGEHRLGRRGQGRHSHRVECRCRRGHRRQPRHDHQPGLDRRLLGARHGPRRRGRHERQRRRPDQALDGLGVGDGRRGRVVPRHAEERRLLPPDRQVRRQGSRRLQVGLLGLRLLDAADGRRRRLRPADRADGERALAALDPHDLVRRGLRRLQRRRRRRRARSP